MKTETKRPPLAQKHTRASEGNREQALDEGLKLTIDGEVFEARVGDVTPAIARELRRNIGMGFMSLMQETARDPDIDVISAFVWVARRIRGEVVAFDDVAVSYEQMLSEGFDVDTTESEDLDDSPEA